MNVTITGLHYYPVKSCAGIAAEEVRLDRYGIEHDRRWMVVHPEGGFRTQRESPRMATISAKVEDGALVLAHPGGPPLRISCSGPEHPHSVTVRIWSDNCFAEDAGDEAAEWLSRYVEVPCRLVRMGHQYHRQVDPAYATPGEEVSFADGFPLLLISEESLEDLNSRLESPVPMNRFRPNMVVRGAGWPFAEDTWSTLTLQRTGDVLRVVKPCARCQMPTIDQQIGRRTGPEPLETLTRYRREGNKVLFGQNLIHNWRGSPITLRVGDTLEASSAPPAS